MSEIIQKDNEICDCTASASARPASEIINRDNINRFLSLMLDVGEGMLCSGADIRKIEETFDTVGKTYGIPKMTAFVIPSLITINIQLDEEFGISQSRRIASSEISTNLHQLSQLNRIAHICRHRPVELDELQQLLDESNEPVNGTAFYVGSACAAGVLAIFFGGNLWDALVALLLGLVICVIKREVSSYITNTFALSFLCALVVGCAAEALGRTFGVLNTDMIIIGDIMLLIPGMGVTLSVRDIIVGDTIAGLIRLTDSIFVTGALAFGFWLAHWFMGG